MRDVNQRVQPVTRQRPCALCGGDHKCGFKDDGLILCGRRSGPQPGFRWLGPARNNSIWHLYRRDDDLNLDDHGFDNPRPRCSLNFPAITRRLAAQMTEQARQDLANQLGLPAPCLNVLTIGFDPDDAHGPCWAFPERDGTGRVIGITRRYADGRQRALPGSQRGLYFGIDWQRARSPIFIVEGASDTLALMAIARAAVGRPSCRGGVEHLARLLQRIDPDRLIYVVGENDARPGPGGKEEWPGRDGARTVALRLSQMLRREVVWTLPPEGFKDVRDWIVAQKLPVDPAAYLQAGDRLEELLRERATSPLDGRDAHAPLPLDAPEPEVPFPLEVLPPATRAFVEQTARTVGCPPAFVALPALAVAGAALGNAWELAVTASHRQTSALFALIVGHPGSGKSPALLLASAPLRRLEQQAIEEHRRALETWRSLPEEFRGPAPKPHRLVVDDFTTEALGPVLEANPKGVLVLKDELAGLINSLNQYRGGKGHDRQVLLSLWAGVDLVIDRKSQKEQGPILVRRPFLAIAGGIQPAVLERLRGSDDRPAVDDGLLDRFLFAFPAPLPIRGEDWSELPERAQNGWRYVIELLAAQQPESLPAPPPVGVPVFMGGTRAPAAPPWHPRKLVLSPGARASWERFTMELARESSAEDFPECLQGPWSKLRGYCARLALVLEALTWADPEQEASQERVPPGEVMAEAVDRAAVLIDWFKTQLRKVHAILGSDARRADAVRVLRWLVDHPEVITFTRRDVHQALRRVFLRASALEAPLMLLVEHRYLNVSRLGRVNRYEVSPLWQPRTI